MEGVSRFTGADRNPTKKHLTMRTQRENVLAYSIPCTCTVNSVHVPVTSNQVVQLVSSVTLGGQGTTRLWRKVQLCDAQNPGGGHIPNVYGFSKQILENSKFPRSGTGLGGKRYGDSELWVSQVHSGCDAVLGWITCPRDRRGPSRHGLNLGCYPRSKRRRNTQGEGQVDQSGYPHDPLNHDWIRGAV